jgi:hypothetical protein
MTTEQRVCWILANESRGLDEDGPTDGTILYACGVLFSWYERKRHAITRFPQSDAQSVQQRVFLFLCTQQLWLSHRGRRYDVFKQKTHETFRFQMGLNSHVKMMMTELLLIRFDKMFDFPGSSRKVSQISPTKNTRDLKWWRCLNIDMYGPLYNNFTIHYELCVCVCVCTVLRKSRRRVLLPLENLDRGEK